ncbi:MAG: DNA polymerase III subunit delta [Gemmatimonadaceae bacterium]
MKALSQAIKERQFSPAYYLHGEDEYRKEDALRRLLNAAVDPATRDFNLDQRTGAELDAATLASLLAMPPMMAERRVVVVRDVTGLRKDARAALDKYLERPAPDLLLVLTAPADAKADKTLGRTTVAVESESLSGAQVPRWIVSRVERDLNTTITSDAIELLQGAVGTDLAQLALELEKLAAYTAGRPIDEAAVTAVVGIRRDETPGRLLDAVAARDVTLALTLIPGVLQQPKTTGVSIVMSLTTQMLAFGIALARNIAPPRLSGEYFNILKSGSSNYTGRAWGEAVSAWSRHTNRWSLSDIDHALRVLLQTDMALKESRVSSDEQILANAVLSMCCTAVTRTAA